MRHHSASVDNESTKAHKRQASSERKVVTLTGALCLLCHDRPAELQDALESARASWNEVIVVDMGSTPALDPVPGTSWHRSEENLGPTAGYNLLASLASSDFLVFLDDDAVLRTPVLDAVTRKFEEDDHLAVVAFKIVRGDGSIRKIEQPFRGKVRHPDRARECAYFLEGACAIRKQAFEEVGGYDGSFFYSVEEVDLSFKLARRGWSLEYAPELVVEHRPSASGRGVTPFIPALTARNRIIVARRYLPWPVAIANASTWTAFMFTKAVRAGSVRPFLGAIRSATKVPVQRDVVSWRTLWHLHRCGGRVLW
jgi:GT2 family glycosyltransferase